MKSQMEPARANLLALLSEHELNAGMSVRIHGDHLILGRDQVLAPGEEPETIESVRFTRLSSSKYGLSVKRHTGRWERTPFSGSIQEMAEAMLTYMQHLVAPW